MGTIFRNVWEISLFSLAVIVPLGLCANLLGRRYGIKWRYLLWVVVAVRLAVPVQLALPERMEGLKMELPAPAVTTGHEARMPSTILIPEPAEPLPATEEMTPFYLPLESIGDTEEPKESLPQYIAGHLEWAWLAGLLAFLIWQGWKHASFRRMLKRNSRKVRDAAVLDSFYGLCREMGLEKRPALYFCGVLPSPLCMGLFRQEIYINSEDREPGDMRLILKHELAHCRRGDLWFKALLLLVRALHFFNPFVHWMARLAERDMEYSCDLSVMRDCTLEERQVYSMAILRTVREGRQCGAVLTTAFSGGKKELKTRFENIFDMSVKKRGVALFAAAALLVCCGTAFVGCQREKGNIVYGDYTEEIVAAMYRAKPISWEDDEAMRNLLGILPVPNGAEYQREDFHSVTAFPGMGSQKEIDTRNTLKYPQNVLIFPASWERTRETAYTLDGETYADNRWQLVHAMIFLALAEDLDGVQFVRMAGNINAQTIIFDRDYMEQYFGKTDLRIFAADEETFRAFVLAINKYFYDGIEEAGDIQKLTELDDASAQKRMAVFLEESGAGILYGNYTTARVHALFEAKLDYIGNAVGVGKIFGLLPMPNGVTFNDEGMELFTDVLPYGAMRHLDWTETPETVWAYAEGEPLRDDRWCTIHALIFFSMVDNADYFNYTLHIADPETGEVEEQQWACTRDELARCYFGETDLREFAADEQTFQRFILALNRYFYEGMDTPQKIAGLYAMEDGAARERMEGMLSLGANANESGGGKMRKVQQLLWAITHGNAETMLSSSPLDYIDCGEYEELVQLGDATLKYCLTAFGAGKELDTLEGYVMMYACQDILGQERREGLTPSEWYFLYTAIDSMICAPFAYDAVVYTEDLEQYTFSGPSASLFGILAAGQDERLRAVYDAAAERYSSGRDWTRHKATIFAPVIYQWEEEGDNLSAYMILHCGELILVRVSGEGYGLYQGGESSLTVRMDFVRRNGTWTLAEWTEADSGERFAESVYEMCAGKPELAEKLINRAYGNEKMLFEQNIVYYMKAHYGGMNIPVYLSSEAEPETAGLIRVAGMDE